MRHYMDVQYPKISIVTQCFNREEYIAETIESVISQGYPNLEYIVIDDNSSDRSWEIIQRYKDKITHAERLAGTRSSPIEAYNYALSKTTGEIMATLNDKNKYMPKSLFAVAKVFSRFPDIEWLTGIGLLLDADGIITGVLPVRRDFYEHMIKVPWNMQHESTFWRRSLWERTGAQFDPEFPWAFDLGLWRKFFFAAKLYHLNTILGAYRKLPTAQSTARKNEFYTYCDKARNDMRAQASWGDLYYTELYRALRPFKPILRNIPDAAWAHIPILEKLSHEAISFQNLNRPDLPQFKRYKRNPFRTMFPW